MGQSNNKRIAKNTLYLYIRMLINILVSLYTSRLVLQILGVVDLGVYNVVGGISTAFVFLSSSLSNATQRYLNFEQGTGNTKRLEQIFCFSLLIYFVYAVISGIGAEVGGLWLIEHKLVIPPERVFAAKAVLFFTSLSLLVTIVSSVYDSVLIARENMKVYAYIGLFDVVAKLVVVFLLQFISWDKLILYAALHFAVLVIAKLISIIYCSRKYEECKIRYYWEKPLFKEMFGFVGWNSIGTIVWILNNQGVDILLNMFFGPVVNAAKAIASQARGIITGFGSNFYTAVRPQIVKSYAAGDLDYFRTLLFSTTKYLFFIIWFISLPLMLRVDYVLKLWLGDVPEYTNVFIIWILIFVLVNFLSDPINTAIQAIGKQRRYILIGSSVYLTVFPISYVALKLGAPPITAFQILVVIRFIFVLIVFGILKTFVEISYRQYIAKVIGPLAFTAIASVAVMLPVNSLFSDNFLSLIAVCTICVIVNGAAILFIGLNANERNTLLRHAIKIIKKKSR